MTQKALHVKLVGNSQWRTQEEIYSLNCVY